MSGSASKGRVVCVSLVLAALGCGQGGGGPSDGSLSTGGGAGTVAVGGESGHDAGTADAASGAAGKAGGATGHAGASGVGGAGMGGVGGGGTGGAGTGGMGAAGGMAGVASGGIGAGAAGMGGVAGGGMGGVTGGGMGGFAGSAGAGGALTGAGGTGVAGAPGSFSSVTPLVPYRTEHTATLLKNGKVLIAGGWNASLIPISMMELFDPATRTFSPGGTMSPARILHSATLLPDGKVLIVAGQVSGGSPGATTSVPSVQIYDPDAGTFSSAPDLARYQYEHVAVSLSDGRVLVVGAYNDNRMQVFDPATGQFTTTGAMTRSRFNGQTATLLNDGKVLVAGGVINATPAYYDGSAEIYDPTTNSFAAAGSMATARAYHNASLLPDGRVLMSGGIEDYPAAGPVYAPDAEIFDPTTKTFVPGPSLPFAYERGTATTLLDNQVLIAGGGTSTGPQANCQLYDPATGTFSITSSLAFARSFQTATLLPGGDVLIVGGDAKSGLPIVPAEIYQ